MQAVRTSRLQLTNLTRKARLAGGDQCGVSQNWLRVLGLGNFSGFQIKRTMVFGGLYGGPPTFRSFHTYNWRGDGMLDPSASLLSGVQA